MAFFFAPQAPSAPSPSASVSQMSGRCRGRWRGRGAPCQLQSQRLSDRASIFDLEQQSPHDERGSHSSIRASPSKRIAQVGGSSGSGCPIFVRAERPSPGASSPLPKDSFHRSGDCCSLIRCRFCMLTRQRPSFRDTSFGSTDCPRPPRPGNTAWISPAICRRIHATLGYDASNGVPPRSTSREAVRWLL